MFNIITREKKVFKNKCMTTHYAAAILCENE